MTDFLNRRTPAQAAGLRPDTVTEDREIWNELKGSREVAAIIERRRAEKLADRESLVAARDAELDRLHAQRGSIAEQKEAARKRRERAEAEFRAAIEAERLLPLYTPDGSQELVDLERQLITTADPRIDEAHATLSREIDVTRAYGAPLEFDPYGRAAGYDQTINAALTARLEAIAAALRELHALRLKALSETEVEAEIERIVGMVAPIPAEASMQARAPAPLPVTAARAQAARTPVAAEAYDRIAAQTAARRRT
jgi:hypothetical protein